MGKTEIVRLRVDPSEKQAFQEAADLAGITLSTWIRERLRRVVRLELEEAGRQIPFIKRRLEVV